jgi:hypothetical protein
MIHELYSRYSLISEAANKVCVVATVVSDDENAAATTIGAWLRDLGVFVPLSFPLYLNSFRNH